MDSFASSAIISATPASDCFVVYDQGQWQANPHYAEVPGWDPLRTDLNLLDSYSNNPKLLHSEGGRYGYQHAMDVLSATPPMETSFFTAEKRSSMLAAAPPAPLSPSPPYISASSHSSSFSSSSGASLGSGMAVVPAASASFSRSASPTTDHRAMSSPSSPDSPDSSAAPLNFAKERRRAQNRRAQQTHRERRAQRLKDLEDRVKELEAIEDILRAENAEIKEELVRLEGMLRTAQLCRQADRMLGFPDPVALWDLIQRHPLVAAGGVNVALVCEELRKLAARTEEKGQLFNSKNINDIIKQCRSHGEAD